MGTVRIYGRRLGAWYSEDDAGRKVATQYEYEYREYDADTGEVVGAGSEDFSCARLKVDSVTRQVWTWDGERRNRGGHRWFEYHGHVTYRPKERADVKRYLKARYGAAVLQLR